VIQHDKDTQEILRKAGMSLESELTPEEIVRLPDAKAALDANPRLSQHRVYRILRPKTDEEW
jgi:hypothetical protein